MGSDKTSNFSKPASQPGGLRVRTQSGDDASIAFLAERLRAGELVAIPTETVYGLAANAHDPQACRRIFEVKGRPLLDPLIVHVSGLAQASEVARLNEAAESLARAFWPGPLTLVLPRQGLVEDIVTASLPTVAVRSPRHPLARKLLEVAQIPLAAPSANPFGYVSPTTAQHVIDGLGERIDHVLDGGPCEIGLESTIVDLSDPENPVILRLGAITADNISRVLNKAVTVRPQAAPGAPVNAPGMLERHYSPNTALLLFDDAPPPRQDGDATIYFTRPSQPEPNAYWFTESASLEEAARNIFSLLRRLDSAGYKRIHCQRAPGHGLADAINDRLQRAAAKR